MGSRILLLAVVVVLLMGVGGGVTFWAQSAKLKREWAERVPERPQGVEVPTQVEAWETRVSSGDLDALAEIAQWYRDQRHGEAALAAYETLIRLDPQRGEWWLGAVAVGAGENRREAKIQLNKARELGVPEARMDFQMGLLAERLGEQVDALGDYQRAVERDPTLVPAWTRLLTLYRSIGDDRAARAAFEAALAASPDAPELLMDRGRRFRERGNWRQAWEDFDRVRQSHPEIAPAWYASAQMLFQLDRPDEARDLLEQKLAENPEDWTALMLLCVEAIAQEDRAEADRWVKRLAVIDPRPSPQDWGSMVLAYQATFGEAPPSP